MTCQKNNHQNIEPYFVGLGGQGKSGVWKIKLKYGGKLFKTHFFLLLLKVEYNSKGNINQSYVKTSKLDVVIYLQLS